MSESVSQPYRPWLFRYAVLTALATLGLIGVGGLVTSHQAGMAVPDWPTTYGYNMFLFPVSQWIGGIFYEHSHRLWASGVGLLTTVLAVWIGLSEKRRWVKWLGWIAFILVVVQGVLGGLRVVWKMDSLGIFHATLAQLFLVLICAMALFLSRFWTEASSSSERPLGKANRRWQGGLLAVTLVILGQLMLGATMRHQHAGLAVPDFPLAYGQLWPAMDEAALLEINQNRVDPRDFGEITAFQIGLHMTHRIVAILILGWVAGLALIGGRKAARSGWIRRGLRVWLGLIVVQAGLGAYTVWSNKAADVATLHVLLGAVSLVWGALLTLLSHKFSVDAKGSLLHSADEFSVDLDGSSSVGPVHS